ncbi:MAG: hypothetical protein J0H98_08285 [Solirubrobacterales bacterium]|nr:hypothetical protein [Solirubrobacterales bacterium]
MSDELRELIEEMVAKAVEEGEDRLEVVDAVLYEFEYRQGRADVLADLLARVENATGGDREIHDAICKGADVIKETGGRFGRYGEEIPAVAKDTIEAFLRSALAALTEGDEG